MMSPPHCLCFLSVRMAVCHVFVMCSFNTWMKPYPEYRSQVLVQLHFLQDFNPMFILFLTILQREEPSDLVRTIIMRFIKQSVVGEKTVVSVCTQHGQ